ncbi:hypothetical protein GE09DRAFT_366805 [Coniochaeta sp. 2T2.1]|nr:hypothetical protein GE09DRAFT_366805 [Coniochaeta sp. 2T2.1]
MAERGQLITPSLPAVPQGRLRDSIYVIVPSRNECTAPACVPHSIFDIALGLVHVYSCCGKRLWYLLVFSGAENPSIVSHYLKGPRGPRGPHPLLHDHHHLGLIIITRLLLFSRRHLHNSSLSSQAAAFQSCLDRALRRDDVTVLTGLGSRCRKYAKHSDIGSLFNQNGRDDDCSPLRVDSGPSRDNWLPRGSCGSQKSQRLTITGAVTILCRQVIGNDAVLPDSTTPLPKKDGVHGS